MTNESQPLSPAPLPPTEPTPARGQPLRPTARWPWKPLLLVMIALSWSRSGCSDCRAENVAENARQGYVNSETDALIFKVDEARMLAETQQLLDENGIRLPGGLLPLDTTVLTEWSGNEDRRTRHSVRLIRAGKEQYMLQLFLLTEEKDSQGSRRTDRQGLPHLEWTLFERLQPQQAATILQEGRRRGQNAYDRQVRWGCDSCGAGPVGCGGCACR